MTADITEIPSFPLLWYLPSKQNNSSEIFRVFCALPLMINFYCWLCVCVSINVVFFFLFPPNSCTLYTTFVKNRKTSFPSAKRKDNSVFKNSSTHFSIRENYFIFSLQLFVEEEKINDCKGVAIQRGNYI
jgi:hypothetical protein